MKKFMATIIVCFTLLISGCNVYALTPADITQPEENQNRVQHSGVYKISGFTNFDYISDCLESFAIKKLETTGKKIIWVLCSLNNHQDIQYHIIYDKNTEEYEEVCSDESYDFIQIGSLMDISVLKVTKEEFEKDPLKATLNFIIPIDASADEEKLYEQLKSHNIPIYWEITQNSSDVFTLEVAIGKYVIQPGDTLSKIALNYQTTVGKLLEDNSNITNSDLIYAGDYLVIK